MNYTILDEGTLRELVTSDLTARGGQFDVVMIGPYEAPQYGEGRLHRRPDVQGLREPRLPARRPHPVDSHGAVVSRPAMYAAPFYGESSFLMYRKDVLEKRGHHMPAHPTWDQVAAIARKVNRPDMAGICLRGKPGWGELGASFTTVLNTFGGTWWSAKPDGTLDKAMVDQPAFRNALEFYVDLVRDAGERDAAGSASTSACRSTWTARSRCGTTRPSAPASSRPPTAR